MVNSINRKVEESYIGSLDGLRSVAIIGVLTYHLFPQILPGGFTGVDVFFVISGYIITKNILEQKAESSFSVGKFYLKRIARLFPALAITICVSLMGAALVVGAERLSIFGQTGVYATFSVSNIFFWLNSGYFEDTSKTNILLHTWSLSVEEQFYLIWPALLLGLWRLGLRGLFFSLSALLIIGAAVSYFASLTHPSAMFYLMPFRVFQFALGACVAATHLGAFPVRSAVTDGRSSALFVLGLLLILVAYWLADGLAYEFWTAAMLPAVGAALAIAAIQSSAARVVLGGAAPRAIGLRAYSLYLAHWPLVVLFNTHFGSQLAATELAFILGGIGVSAELLYRLVEKPLRIRSGPGSEKRRSRDGWRIFSVVVLALATTLACAHFWALNRQGPGGSGPISLQPGPTTEAAPSSEDARGVDYTALLAQSIETNGSATRAASRHWAEWINRTDPTAACQLGGNSELADFDREPCLPTDPAPNIALLGDSVGREGVAALTGAGFDRPLAVASRAGCLPIYPERPRYSPVACRSFNEMRFAYLSNPQVQTVVLIGNWRNSDFSEIEGTVEYLLGLEKRVVLFLPRPALTESAPTLLDGARGAELAGDISGFVAYDHAELSNRLRARFENQPRVHLVDSAAALCPNGVCPALLASGNLIYLDAVHLSRNAAIEVGRSARGGLAEFISRASVHPASEQ